MAVNVRGNKENYVIYFVRLITASAAVINTYLGNYYSFMEPLEYSRGTTTFTLLAYFCTRNLCVDCKIQDGK